MVHQISQTDGVTVWRSLWGSIEFAATDTTTLTLDLRGQQVEYHDGTFVYGKSQIPAAPVDGVVALRVLIDRASVELFANHGAAVSTHYATPDASDTSVAIGSKQDVQIKSLSVHKLNSVWSK